MFERSDLFTLVLLTAVTTSLAAGSATAQSFPSRPMTLVVPFGVGSGSDLVARILGARMSELLGQTVVIENVSGAGGMTVMPPAQRTPQAAQAFVESEIKNWEAVIKASGVEQQ